MTSSLTVTCSGTAPVIQCNFLPEITLDAQYNYSCALLDLTIKSNTGSDKIAKLGVLRVNCDLISGSYINGVQSHVIHQFTASASHASGKYFVEIPKNLNYLPVKNKIVQSIQISICNSEGKLLKINDCEVTCQLNIKRDTINEKIN